MTLEFNLDLVKDYKSQSQIARILTENWVMINSYCPSCGNNKLECYDTNNPAADFYCLRCHSDYELKSSRKPLENRVVDGAFNTMISKITSYTNPHFFFLNYSTNYRVMNFYCIPKHFFIPEIIEKRKPLKITARRAGWVGCNILIKNLPISARIYLIKNNQVMNSKEVIRQWDKTSFLNNEEINNRGWLIELITIIDKIPNKIFSLAEVYAFENTLAKKFPHNNFIKEKIRQQLQVLRNNGIIEFLGKGIYKRG